MLTLVQIKSLVSRECEWQGRHNHNCEDCHIYNLFNRAGNCEERLFLDQSKPEVAAVIKRIQLLWSRGFRELD